MRFERDLWKLAAVKRRYYVYYNNTAVMPFQLNWRFKQSTAFSFVEVVCKDREEFPLYYALFKPILIFSWKNLKLQGRYIWVTNDLEGEKLLKENCDTAHKQAMYQSFKQFIKEYAEEYDKLYIQSPRE